MNENQRLLLLDWMRKMHQYEYAHREQSTVLSVVHFALGISVIIMGSILGVLHIFESDSLWISGLLGIGVAVATSISTFVRSQEYAERHRHLSVSFEKLRHHIEYVMINRITSENAEAEIHKINTQLAEVDAVNVWNWIYEKSCKKVKGEGIYPEKSAFLSSASPSVGQTIAEQGSGGNG